MSRSKRRRVVDSGIEVGSLEWVEVAALLLVRGQATCSSQIYWDINTVSLFECSTLMHRSISSKPGRDISFTRILIMLGLRGVVCPHAAEAGYCTTSSMLICLLVNEVTIMTISIPNAVASVLTMLMLNISAYNYHGHGVNRMLSSDLQYSKQTIEHQNAPDISGVSVWATIKVGQSVIKKDRSYTRYQDDNTRLEEECQCLSIRSRHGGFLLSSDEL